jgi:predicted porin
MKNVVLTVASTVGFFGNAYAQSSVTLYGALDAGVSYVTNAATTTGHGQNLTFADGVGTGNRWGLRGTEDLGGEMEAIFALESGFSLANGTAGQGGAEFGRQAWVGLSKNDVGSISLGRQYSFSTEYLGSNYTMGSQTAAGNYAYHINDLDQLTASRINNSVKISSAVFHGLTAGAMYGFSNQAGGFSGSPTTTTAGVTTQGSSSAYSFGLNYTATQWGIGAAYTNIRYPNGATPAFSVSIANVNTSGLRDLETYGVGTRYLVGNGTLWGNWTRTRFSQLVGGSSALNNFEVGGKYLFTPAFIAGLGYTYTNLNGQFSGHWNQLNSALDYILSKRTDVYFLAIYQKASGSNLVAGKVVPVQAEIGSSTSFFGSSGVGASNQLALRVGVRHRF